MKKSLLLCFWGHRMDHFLEVKDNFEKIFSDFEIDFLISTWDDVNTDNHNFKFIIKTPPPTATYLNEINFLGSGQIRHYSDYDQLRFGQYALFFHKFKIHEFINNNQLKYDTLVIARTDLWFETDHIFDFQKDIIYVPLNFLGGPGVVNDHFLCGKFDYTLKAISLPSINDYGNLLETSWNPEHTVLRIFENLNLDWTEFQPTKYKLLPNRYWEF